MGSYAFVISTWTVDDLFSIRLYPWGQIPLKFESKYKKLQSRKGISKFRLQNIGHFVVHLLWYLTMDWIIVLFNCTQVKMLTRLTPSTRDSYLGTHHNAHIQIHHYSDVIMSAMASQTTGVSIVCSAVCSGTDQRNHQRSVALAFVRGIHRWPVVPLTKGQWRGKCFHLMTSSCTSRCSINWNFRSTRKTKVQLI